MKKNILILLFLSAFSFIKPAELKEVAENSSEKILNKFMLKNGSSLICYEDHIGKINCEGELIRKLNYYKAKVIQLKNGNFVLATKSKLLLFDDNFLLKKQIADCYQDFAPILELRLIEGNDLTFATDHLNGRTNIWKNDGSLFSHFYMPLVN